MKQVVINQFEKVASVDFNNIQLAMAKTIQDDVMYNFFGRPSGGVILGLAGSYVGALATQISIGAGFYYDSTQTGFNPNFREIISAAVINVTHTAAPVSYPRIDLVCLAPNLGVTATANRYVKTGGVGPITLTSVNKSLADSYTLQVVAGTPASSPTVPATPAGYIALYQALVSASTGISGSGAITDVRSFLVGPSMASTSVASNTNHVTATGVTTQAQLDQLDDATTKTKFINPNVTPVYNLSTTLLTGDKGRLFLVNTLAPTYNMTFNLPAPVANFEFTIKDYPGQCDIRPITLHRYGSENIENLAADLVLQAPYGEWTIYSDGTNWYVGGR